MEETCCDSSGKAHCWSDLEEMLSCRQGESTILVLEPFITFDRQQAETATGDVKP
jgi:hypothetical protein